MANPANCRRYGEILLGITRTGPANWYTVIGRRGTLLNFLVGDDGERLEVPESWGGTKKPAPKPRLVRANERICEECGGAYHGEHCSNVEEGE